MALEPLKMRLNLASNRCQKIQLISFNRSLISIKDNKYPTHQFSPPENTNKSIQSMSSKTPTEDFHMLTDDPL